MKLSKENYIRLSSLDMCEDYRRLLNSYADDIIIHGCANVKQSDIDAAKKASDSKQLKVLNEIFPSKGLEVGKWYKHNGNLYFYQGDGVRTYGFGITVDWVENITVNWNNDWEEAAKGEVKNRLVEEAEKRGFKEGVLFDSVKGSSCHDRNKQTVESIGFSTSNNALYTPYGVIFHNGEWAKIVEGTYCIGDRFKSNTENKYILAQVEANVINLINLKTGNRGTDRVVEAENVLKITQDELDRLGEGLKKI